MILPTKATEPLAAHRMIAKAIQGRADAIDRALLGHVWTVTEAGGVMGLAQSPSGPASVASRTMSFPGTLKGSPASEIAAWIEDWQPHRATLGLAAANALINGPDNELLQAAQPINPDPSMDSGVPAHLAVFHHFKAQLTGRKVVVIGRYPKLDSILDSSEVTVLERSPGGDDLPDPAAEVVLPEADWVFITATSLINKTFSRLAQLADGAVTVLMGPSLPWLEGFKDFGIDYLAGVAPIDPARAYDIAAEGGGTRLFGEGVGYRVADIGVERMEALKAVISSTADRRVALKAKMEDWYAAGNTRRFPDYAELERVSIRLSGMDTRYKRQWDARFGAEAMP
ncbi:MAG: Rossmann-like domain-containing protein [Magnetovibrionaceae bacterium]